MTVRTGSSRFSEFIVDFEASETRATPIAASVNDEGRDIGRALRT